MAYIFAAAFFFGLVHPGSKLILDSGLDLVSFCLLYVGIRLIVQLALVAYSGQYRVAGRKTWITLVSIGVVGAALQLSEFKGIASGLPVPLVTFLVYSHPVWSTLLSRFINKEHFTRESWLKLAFGIVGILCITGAEIKSLDLHWQSFVAPLFAGLMIGLWVSLSNLAKKSGASALTISFYYDLFAFSSLLIVLPAARLDQASAWLTWPSHVLGICAYAVAAGLLPNLLFYRGSFKVPARAAGLILLIEPAVATALSHVLWHDHLARFFYVGVGLVLLAGLPSDVLRLDWFKGIWRQGRDLRV